MIFLGAGASKCFGIPTSPTLTSEMEELVNGTYPDLIEDIKTYLKKHKRNFDFEIGLTILTALTDPNRVPDRNHYSHFFADDYPQHRGDYSEIIDRMHGMVYDYCTAPFTRGSEKFLSPEALDSIFTMTYDVLMGVPLFKGVRDVLFSTNYDPTIELWCKKRFLDSMDGTSGTNNPDFRRVQTTEDHLKQIQSYLDRGAPPHASDQPEEIVPLIRLHGSVWTYDITGSPYRMKFSVPRDQLLFPDLYKDRIQQRPRLILPGQEDKLRRVEWDRLYQFFKEKLKGYCLFIGYSFRHDVINEPILDNLEVGLIKKLGILSPDPQKNLDNLLRGEGAGKSFDSKIHKMPARFGHNDSIQELLRWLSEAYHFNFGPDLLHTASHWRRAVEKKYFK